MKKLFSFLLLFFLLTLPFSVFAQTRDRVVTLTRDQTINGPYFAAGNTVVVSGTVNGDVYVAGGTVTVDGTINGDLIAAGGNLSIRGNVRDDVRVAGGDITVGGVIGKNLTVGAGNITILPTASVGGIVAGAGKMQIGSPVNGDVYAGVGELTLLSTARISGNLNYASKNSATLENGAIILGATHFKQTEPTQEQKQVAQQARSAALITGKIISFVMLFIIGLLFMRLTPQFTKQTVSLVETNTLKDLGVGFLVLVLAPILSIVLMVTVIGFPLGILLLFGYVVVLYVGKIFVSLYLGDWILTKFTKTTSMIWMLFVGLITYQLLTLIPVLGGIVGFFIMLVGVGALYLSKKQSYSALRKKNLI